MKINTFKVMDCSTVHISNNDARLLEKALAGSDGPVLVVWYPEGYFVYTASGWSKSRAQKELVAAGFSQAFADLMVIASEAGAKWLNVDADGPEYKGLQKFDW